MKNLKSVTVIFFSAIIIFSAFLSAGATAPEDENRMLLTEYGFPEEYLNTLTDSMLAKMAEQIRETRDPDYMGNYEYLLFIGIPDDFLKGLPETTLNKIREYIRDNNISAVDYSTQKATSSDAIIKKLSLQLTDENDSTVLNETVCIYWEHEPNKPINRNEDFLTVSWNKDIFCYDADSFYAEDYRRNSIEEHWNVSDRYSALSKISLNSIGHWTKLYTTKKQVGGFMIFRLSPAQPIDSGTDYNSELTADYSYETETHDFTTVIICIAFVLIILTSLAAIMKKKKRKQ